ncbi:MAG: hypothetical protein IJ677_05985, partial [Alphaproteobacteria bacterium]|nr:hypothetical protein [Alphaproteobacteria bacterium]
MAKYNSFDEAANNPRFAEFIKERFGIDDVSKISPVEQSSIFNVFKSFEGDLTQDDLFGMFHEMGEALYETGQVNDDEVNRFIAAKEEYIRRNPQEKEQINADIERFLNNDLENGRKSQTEMFGGFTYTFDEAFRNRYHRVENEYLKAIVESQPEPQPIPEPQPMPEPEPEPQPQPMPNQVVLEEVRVRSHDNFDNESAMYRIELAILAERKLINEDEAQKAINAYTVLLRERDILSGLSDDETQHFTSNVSTDDLAAGYELVNQGRSKIAEKDTEAYKLAIVDKVLDAALKEQDKQNGDNVWYDLLTPELTAVGIEGLQNKLNNKSLKEDEKAALEKNFDIIMNHGEGLLEDLTKKEGYY